MTRRAESRASEGAKKAETGNDWQAMKHRRFLNFRRTGATELVAYVTAYTVVQSSVPARLDNVSRLTYRESRRCRSYMRRLVRPAGRDPLRHGKQRSRRGHERNPPRLAIRF